MTAQRMVKLADIVFKWMIECHQEKMGEKKGAELLQERLRGLGVTNQEFTEVLEFLKFSIEKVRPEWDRYQRRNQRRKRKIHSKPSLN